MHWTVHLLAVGVGFWLLALGAERLVRGGEALARRWGVSPFLVGLTIVAWGTSLPEVVVSSLAAAQGRPATCIGNVLGSNIANIGLVLGASSIILPAQLMRRPPLKEASWLVGTLVLLWFLLADGGLDRLDAFLLIGAFVAHNLHLFHRRGEVLATGGPGPSLEGLPAPRSAWLLVLGGSVAIYSGAQAVMWGGTHIADQLGLGDTLLGLSILAIGSSLPELFACMASARQGDAQMGLGNVIGSNVFNTLAVTGLAAGLSPFGGEDQIALALDRDFPLCLLFTLGLFVWPPLSRWVRGTQWHRLPAALLLIGYLSYLVKVSLAG